MAKICPQRILKEAIAIVEELTDLLEDVGSPLNPDSGLAERIGNNSAELESLGTALYRMGIVNVEEA